MKMSKLVAGVLVASAVALLAPEPTQAAAPPRTQQRPWPIAEMQKLEALEGTWECTGSAVSRPGATPISSTSKANVRFTQGQRWMQWDVTTVLANGFTGSEFAVWGWDARLKAYTLESYGEGYRATLLTKGWKGDGSTMTAVGLTSTASAQLVKTRSTLTHAADAVTLVREYETNGQFFTAVTQSCHHAP